LSAIALKDTYRPLSCASLVEILSQSHFSRSPLRHLPDSALIPSSLPQDNQGTDTTTWNLTSGEISHVDYICTRIKTRHKW